MTSDAPSSGQYEILERIAVGGMAEIYLAKQSRVAGFSRSVVLKRVLPEYAADQAFVDAFLREARLCAQLNHPNIVQILDLGKMQDTYFIALEHIDGPDGTLLLQHQRQLGVPMPLTVALHIVTDLLVGLDFAHNVVGEDGQSLGLVHRDVSPSNLLVAYNGVAKVVDFGIAKATSRQVEGSTKTGVVKGKLGYLAPELIKRGGVAADRRIDVFAAGVVLYELLTNLHPFRGDGELDTLQNIVHADPQPLSTLGPAVAALAADWEPVLSRALCKDPAQRFQSCAEFAQAIEVAATRAGLALSPFEVQAYMQANRAVFDALLRQRRAHSQGVTGTDRLTSPEASVQSAPAPVAADSPPTKKLTLGPGPGQPPAETATPPPLNPTPPPDRGARDRPDLGLRGVSVPRWVWLAGALLIAVAAIVGALASRRAANLTAPPPPPPAAAETTKPTAQPTAQPTMIAAQASGPASRSALSQRNHKAVVDTALLDHEFFMPAVLAEAQRLGVEPRSVTPGLCARAEMNGEPVALHLSQQPLLAVLHAGVTYSFRWMFHGELHGAKFGKGRAWLEVVKTETKAKKPRRVGVPIRLTAPGPVDFVLPQRTLSDGFFQLLFVFERAADKRISVPLTVFVAPQLSPYRTDTDADGDCFYKEEGDCADDDERVNILEIERCDNGIDDNCDGVVDQCR